MKNLHLGVHKVVVSGQGLREKMKLYIIKYLKY